MTDTTAEQATPAPTITRQGDRHAIAFPIELKDQFRAAFRSAKWDPQYRVWTVGPRSRTRLEAWADEVRASGILEDLAARDERDLSVRELSELRHRIARLRSEIGAAEAARREAEDAKAACTEVRTTLDADRPRLDAAREAAVRENDELDAARTALWARLEGIVDLAEIEGLRREMLRTWRAQTARNRERFEPLQRRMREIRDAMHDVGVTSRAVRLAAAANYNRPDRDRDDLALPVEMEVHDEDA